PQGKMRLALAERRLGHAERAADIAWEVAMLYFARDGTLRFGGLPEGQLDAATLYNAGTLQMHSDPIAEPARERTDAIAEALRTTFLGDEQAARYRLMLLATLGEATSENAAAPNVDAGKHLRDAMLVASATAQGYAKGELPFEALVDLTAIPPAS